MKRNIEYYYDIINMERPVSQKYPPMSIKNRAAQFAPFSALQGHDAAVAETARYVDSKIILGDSQLEEINNVLLEIKNNINKLVDVSITYFEKDNFKKGGHYLSVSSTVKKIDEIRKEVYLVNGLIINMNNIFTIEIIPIDD